MTKLDDDRHRAALQGQWPVNEPGVGPHYVVQACDPRQDKCESSAALADALLDLFDFQDKTPGDDQGQQQGKEGKDCVKGDSRSSLPGTGITKVLELRPMAKASDPNLHRFAWLQRDRA